MRFGFPVSRYFTNIAQVKCVELTARQAAHTIHRGTYAGLSDANSQLHEWCIQQSLNFVEIYLEVYGDWSQDESCLVTDIIHLLV
jgi:effector-binding domain-containing protein